MQRHEEQESRLMDWLLPDLAEAAPIVVGLLIFFESLGIPLPAESLLIISAIHAGRHEYNIYVLVGCAALGAIMGDNVGYLIGKSFGYRLLVKYGSRIGFTEDRMLLGRYIFKRWGAKVVLFGRFVAFLRIIAAVLAGVNKMDWKKFFMANAVGGILWTCSYGFGAYFIGRNIKEFVGPLGIMLAVLVIPLLVWLFFYVRKNERELMKQAKDEINHMS
jgi:membrane protein DedA with SNARE-associated domain